jgi:allophanate hydrolase subunit 2
MARLSVVSAAGRPMIVDGGPRRGRVWAADGETRFAAADDVALAVANAAVKNAVDTAAVEVFMAGVVVIADADVVVAVSGAPGDVFVDDVPAAVDVAVHLKAGQRLKVGAPRAGLFRVLAVRGGVAASLGLRLNKGEVVDVDTVAPVDVGTAAPSAEAAHGADVIDVRIVEGGEVDRFPPGAFLALCGPVLRVSPQSSRMGVRLLPDGAGSALTAESIAVPTTHGTMLTTPMWTGAVQVTPTGEAIVLGADSRATGGYPRLAQVISVDRHLVAQRRPGQGLRFVRCVLDDARALRRAFAARWR